MDETEELRQKLEIEAGIADWKLLKPHFDRGAVVIVKNGFNIIDIGLQIACNNTEQVQEWISTGTLIKPTLPQIESWEEKTLSFHSLVVAPFVLIQEIKH